MLGVAHVLGLVLAIFGVAYVLPVGCSIIVGDGLWLQFIVAAAINTGVGLAIALATVKFRRELKPRDGFLLVTLVWVLMSASATIPLLLALPQLSFTRAFFETMSGLTTTGSTVLTDLEHLPRSLVFWRHSLQWFGGTRHHRHGAGRPAAAGRRRHAALQGGGARVRSRTRSSRRASLKRRNHFGSCMPPSRGSASSRCESVGCRGSTRSATRSRWSVSAASPRTTPALRISIRLRSSSC